MDLLNPEDLAAAKKSKPGRGGKREGAGRPKGSTHIPAQFKRVTVSFRLPQHLVDWIKAQPIPMATLMEDLIYEHMTKGLNLTEE